MNDTARLMPTVRMDTSRPCTSPDQKPTVWSNGTQMINLSPQAGDQAAMMGMNSEPLQSGSASRDNGDGWSPDLDKSGDDISGDPEGVWSADIEQAFQEALAIYPPCGRRKIILSDEGKMYGRNELIARYIKIRCGKTRTRKQVSSHIQVLARKKAREGHGGKMKGDTSSPPSSHHHNSSTVTSQNTVPESPALAMPTQKELEQLSQLSQLSKTAPLFPHGICPSFFPGMPTVPGGFPAGFNPNDIKAYQQHLGTPLYNLPLVDLPKALSPPVARTTTQQEPTTSISAPQLSLQGFTAYVEPANGERKEIMSIQTTVDGPISDIQFPYICQFFPDKLEKLYKTGNPDAFFLVKCWANVQYDADPSASLYAVDSFYSSQKEFNIKVSTQACSFGKEVVEKIETFSPSLVKGRYVFQLTKSAMCEYMVTFITELKKLEGSAPMNSVLENFTVLQVISNEETGDTLMVLALMFAVSDSEITSELFRLVP